MKPPSRNGALGLMDRMVEWQGHQLSAKRARDQRRDLAMGQTSGVHDTGGLATDKDLTRAGCDNPKGRYLALTSSASKFVLYPGFGSLMTFGKPEIGKGATVGQTQLGHLGNDWSVFVVDFGGENYRVSVDYRRDELGQIVRACNPANQYGIKSVGIDPIAHIRAAGAKRKFRKVVRLAGDFVQILLPEKPGNKDDGWVIRAARQIFKTILVAFALEQPELCNLPAMYDLVCLPAIDLVQFLLDNSRLKFIHKRLRILREDIVQKAGKQLHWKLEVLTEALEPFERRTELGRSLLHASYDPAEMKSQPTTLYLIVPGASIEGYASYISCVLTSLVAQLAEAPGNQKVLFLIDECSQLPPIKLGKWVRLHRKDGLSFWTFWQSTSSVYATYSKAEASDLFESCAVKQYLGVEEIEVARRLSEKAGTTTVYGHSMNRGGDGRSAQDSNAEIEKKVLPVSRILNLGLDEQIIEMTGLPLILGKRYPWWDIEPYCDRLNHFYDMPDSERYPEDDDDLFEDDFIDLDDEDSPAGAGDFDPDDSDWGDDE